MSAPRCRSLLPFLVPFAFVSPANADPIKLGDVVKEAKKPPEQQQTVGQQPLSDAKTKEPIQPQPPPPPAPREAPRPCPIEYVVLAPPLPPPVPYYTSYGTGEWRSGGGGADSDVRMRIGTVGGGGALANDAIGGYGAGGVLLGFGTDRVSLDGRALYSSAGLSSDLSPAMRSFDGWAGDVVLRMGFLPRASPWGLNAMLAGRWGRYGWDFRNPVTVVGPGGTRVVRDDSIDYTSFLAGLGFEPVRRGDWSLGVTAAYGFQFFDDATKEGFENDIFEDRGVFETVAELVYSPSWSSSEEDDEDEELGGSSRVYR